jgi:hypothetical protein
MTRERFYRTLLIAVGVVGLFAIGTAPAIAQTPTVVIRGSSSADGLSGTSGSATVLRGSQLPPPIEAYGEEGACPPGLTLDPNSGCVPPVYADEPPVYGYEPYDDYWLYGLPVIEPPHRFRHRTFSNRRAPSRLGLARPSPVARAAQGGERFGRR